MRCALPQAVGRALPVMPAQAQANILWALARMEYRPSKLWIKVRPRHARQRPQHTTRQTPVMWQPGQAAVCLRLSP